MKKINSINGITSPRPLMRIVIAALPSVAAWVVCASATAAWQIPAFKIGVKKIDDSVGVLGDKDKVIFVVKSKSGIGSAAIERQADAWPKTVILHVHLNGLESFQIGNGKLHLQASVSSTKDVPSARVWESGKEHAPLERSSPLWMSVQALNADGKAAKVPLKDGYFEITLPMAFFENQPARITLSWVDFYR